MKTMSRLALSALFTSLLASVGTAGCECPTGETETLHPRLPPANPGGSPAPAFDPEVVTEEECLAVCGGGFSDCYASAIGNVPAIACVVPFDCGGAGRRPRGLHRFVPCRAADRSAPAMASPAGPWLARAAHLEAASVFAFDQLAEELGGLGAPPQLVARVRRAAQEETRHARVVGRLARRFGGVAPPARVRRRPPRGVLALAIENGVVGCVEETFAALVAHHQAERAEDPAVRRAMRRIAREEAGHASLSLRVGAFLATQLDPRGRARVERAAQRALARLVHAWSVDPDLVGPLGLPDSATGRALAAAMGQALLPRSSIRAGSRGAGPSWSFARRDEDEPVEAERGAPGTT